MKILTAQQIKILDSITLQKQSLTETDLVMRAGKVLAQSISTKYKDKPDLYFFCGNSKNGADGLVCAEELSRSGFKCFVYIVHISKDDNHTFTKTLEKIDTEKVRINYINNETNFPEIPSESLIVDAIIGTGVNAIITGLPAEVIHKINSYKNITRIAIDIPSGLACEGVNYSGTIVKADITYTFELPKLNILLADNYKFVGDWQILPIDLDSEQLSQIDTQYEYIDNTQISKLLLKLKREKFSHKGSFGHTLIVAGSIGKIGAVVLATKACLRSGSGLVTSYIPSCGYNILQTTVPEAMVICDKNSDIISKIEIDPNQFETIAIGPGLGKSPDTLSALTELLERANQPLVLDADALNLISSNRSLLDTIPKQSILTPHPKEFDRMVGSSLNSYSRLEKQINFAIRYNLIVILKGAHSSIALPDGKVFFNSTGNPGMATAGSGDILTGMIAGLLAQGLSSTEASILGVFMHGLAGDRARKHFGETSMIATDIVESIRL